MRTLADSGGGGSRQGAAAHYNARQMSHPRPSSPLCGPSRLRHLAPGALLLAAALGASPALHAQDEPLCPAEAAANPHGVPSFKETKPDPNALIDILSDEAILRRDGTVDLQGNVVVRQGDREIHAQDAHYNRATNGFDVKGAVEFQDPLVKITGQNGRYAPSVGGDFNQADFSLRQRSARGSAHTVDLSPNGILNLKGVVFTTCPKLDQSWLLRAGDLRLDTVKRVGAARSAEVDFKGVPIFYVPWLTFPLSEERKSGFLFPTFGTSSRNGVELEVPWYWNIAPNADLTFEPLVYSRRGIDLGGDGRWLTSDQSGELLWHFLPADRAFRSELTDADETYESTSAAESNGTSASTDRSFVQLKDTFELPAAWRLHVEAASVSDTLYFQDFGSGPEGTSITFLQRLLELTYADDSWRLGVQAQQYQTVDLTLHRSDGPFSPILPVYSDYEPYARTPRAYADADFSLGPDGLLRYGFDSEVVDFTRSVGVTGWRLDLMPHLGIDVEDPGFFIRPGIAWRYTHYDLSDLLPGEPSAPSRELPIGTFDAGLRFERLAGTDGDRTLTLEPRVQYLYVPYRDQSELPLFDTALPDLNMVELFRTNQYVGADRVSNANQVTLGVTSRLIESDSGQQFLAATLGQAYYLSAPRVILPGEAAPSPARSDLIAELDVTAYRHWNIQIGEEWETTESQSERTFVQLQFKPAQQSVVNVAYRYQRSIVAPCVGATPGPLTPEETVACTDEFIPKDFTLQRTGLEQAEVSGAWPLSDHWNGLARMVYALDAHETLDAFAGFEYRSCCWGLRLLARRYLVNGTGTQDTAVLLQLELMGLASVGSAPDAFLGQAIRGYSRSTPIP
jgi:LPS-assembly protein